MIQPSDAGVDDGVDDENNVFSWKQHSVQEDKGWHTIRMPEILSGTMPPTIGIPTLSIAVVPTAALVQLVNYK